MIKILLRIIIGCLLTPWMLLMTGWIWLFENTKEPYCWDLIWYNLSGQWEKLPE
jgi:hypothetical protein